MIARRCSRDPSPARSISSAGFGLSVAIESASAADGRRAMRLLRARASRARSWSSCAKPQRAERGEHVDRARARRPDPARSHARASAAPLGSWICAIARTSRVRAPRPRSACCSSPSSAVTAAAPRRARAWVADSTSPPSAIAFASAPSPPPARSPSPYTASSPIASEPRPYASSMHDRDATVDRLRQIDDLRRIGVRELDVPRVLVADDRDPLDAIEALRRSRPGSQLHRLA